MSDLAPFVAAVIRDKVVQDLQEENDSLRRQLRDLRRVEIIGGEGRPVYAQAQFDEDGEFGLNPNLFQVDLKANNSVFTCKLSDLPNVQLSLGGIKRASFSAHNDFEGILNCSDDENATVSFNFCFVDNFWIVLEVHNWPKDELEIVEDEWDADGEVVMDYLDEIARKHPDSFLTFDHVSFFVSEYRSYINQIPVSERKAQEIEERHNVRELEVIKLRMGLLGSEQVGKQLDEEVNDIHDALSRMGINEASNEFLNIVDPLIRLKLIYPNDFQGFMNQIIEELAQLGPDVGFVDVIREFCEMAQQEVMGDE